MFFLHPYNKCRSLNKHGFIAYLIQLLRSWYDPFQGWPKLRFKISQLWNSWNKCTFIFTGKYIYITTSTTSYYNYFMTPHHSFDVLRGDQGFFIGESVPTNPHPNSLPAVLDQSRLLCLVWLNVSIDLCWWCLNW